MSVQFTEMFTCWFISLGFVNEESVDMFVIIGAAFSVCSMVSLGIWSVLVSSDDARYVKFPGNAFEEVRINP